MRPSPWRLGFHGAGIDAAPSSLRVSQADDVRALLTAAMPPSALPSCYKPQVISVSATAAAAAPSGLSAGPAALPSSTAIDSQAGGFPELLPLLAPSAAEGPVGGEQKEEGVFPMILAVKHFFNPLTS